RRLKSIRQLLKEIRGLHPEVVKKIRAALLGRIEKAGLAADGTDDRVAKEIFLFADRSDISEELTRLESHLAQFAHHLRKRAPANARFRLLRFLYHPATAGRGNRRRRLHFPSSRGIFSSGQSGRVSGVRQSA